MSSQTPVNMSSDTERQTDSELYMFNHVAHTLSWSNVTLTVVDRSTKEPRDVIKGISGHINAGTCPTTICETILLT
jgi:hypothetical protein